MRARKSKVLQTMYSSIIGLGLAYAVRGTYTRTAKFQLLLRECLVTRIESPYLKWEKFSHVPENNPCVGMAVKEAAKHQAHRMAP
jgi:hypothetical protein